LLDWVLAGNKLGDYCGYIPPELLNKLMDAGLLNEGGGDVEPKRLFRCLWGKKDDNSDTE